MKEHIEAIADAPAPQNIGELRSWLGMVNFQAPFVASLSTLTHPLNALLSANKTFNWSDECAEAIAAMKKAITEAPA